MSDFGDDEFTSKGYPYCWMKRGEEVVLLFSEDFTNAVEFELTKEDLICMLGEILKGEQDETD